MQRSIQVLGFVLVGAIAACGQPVEPTSTQVRGEAAVAAVVNGEPLYLSDVELEAASQGLTDPGEPIGLGHPDYQTVLDQLIDQKLLAQEAVARGLNLDNMARRRLDSARERVLGNILVESLVATEVSDARIREMYSEQVALQQIDDEVRIRHILVETPEAAEAARLRIVERGEDFETVAFDESIDTATRIEGGELGFVEPNRMGEPFASMIADTPVGEVSAPFETDQGWHIIKVEDRRTPPPKTFEEMRPEIVTFLTYGEISRILKDLRSDAVIDPGQGVPRVRVPDEPEPAPPADDTL